MPDSLIKQFGYKPLTTEVKRQVFGLNAAGVYGVDPKAKRRTAVHERALEVRRAAVLVA